MTQDEIRDKEGYKWIRFYEKLADCLYNETEDANDNHNRKKFEIVKNILNADDTVDNPFKLFGLITKKRDIEKIENINRALELNVTTLPSNKEEWKGCYLFEQNFFNNRDGVLWKLFIEAVKYCNDNSGEAKKRFEIAFNKAIFKGEGQQRDNAYNITVGLSWFRPLDFMAMSDTKMKSFWQNRKCKDGKDYTRIMDHKDDSGETYLELLAKVKEEYNDKTFPELTYEILESNNQSKGEETMADMDINETIKKAIEDYRQVIFTGAPGTGKTYGVKMAVDDIVRGAPTEKDKKIEIDERIQFVQFHSSYDYSDFVEGLRPVKIGDSNTFVRLDGHFKEFCRKAVENNLEQLLTEGEISGEKKLDQINSLKEKMTSDAAKEIKKKIRNEFPQFYFIIDEINRADIGKVFGELMYGLEAGYRGVENRFDTQYSNLDTYHKDKEKDEFVKYKKEEDVFYEGFFIPENVHIIGTMNDIDRSVETFDFALRRRFQWVRIPAYKGEEGTKESYIQILKEMINQDDNPDSLGELVSRIGKLNKKISEKKELGLSDDYCLGQAYFKWDGSGTDDQNTYPYSEIWEKRIEPILREYVRGRNSEKVDKFIDDCRKEFVRQSEDGESGDNKTEPSSEN